MAFGKRIGSGASVFPLVATHWATTGVDGLLDNGRALAKSQRDVAAAFAEEDNDVAVKDFFELAAGCSYEKIRSGQFTELPSHAERVVPCDAPVVATPAIVTGDDW